MPYYPKRRYNKKPYTARKKAPVRKYKPKNSYKYKTRATTMSMPSLIVPDRAFTKLKYSERVTLTSTTGAVTSYQFNGNSLFDPNRTGSGTQPEGFDQWSNLYQKYRVYGSKINVKIIGVGTTAPTQVVEFCLVPSSDTTSYTSIDDARAAPYSQFKVGNVLSSTQYLNGYISTRKMEGLSKGAIMDDTYSALVTANPASVYVWNVVAATADHASTTSSYAYVTITYYCEFFHRAPLSVS